MELPGLRERAPMAEYALVVGLFLLYLVSFERGSAVNGPGELFAQDSPYILISLFQGEVYPFNPQNHVLYHHLVEGGYALWQRVFTHEPESVYRYLKFFTALTGLAFLLSLRWLLLEIGLGPERRLVLLTLAGLSVSAWFHFAGFETHALATPALCIYLIALVRLARAQPLRRVDRALLVGSLVVCVWARTDLWRFAALSALLPLFPAFRGRWRVLLADLVVVAVVGAAGTLWMVHRYLDVPLLESPRAAIERADVPHIEPLLMRPENLRPGELWQVGRAISVYAFAMPVGEPDQRTGFFRQPLLSMASHPVSLAAGVAVSGVLLYTLFVCAPRVIRGDPIPIAAALHGVTGWVFFTWFNPHEPFLWILEFLPLQMAAIAVAGREGTERVWWLLTATAALVAVHNAVFFYLKFR